MLAIGLATQTRKIRCFVSVAVYRAKRVWDLNFSSDLFRSLNVVSNESRALSLICV